MTHGERSACCSMVASVASGTWPPPAERKYTDPARTDPPELRARPQHDAILVQLREDRRDLALAERVVQRIVDHQGRDAEPRGGGAIDLHSRLQALVELVRRHVVQFGQLPQTRHELRRPGTQLRLVRVLQAVLELRPTDAILDGQILDGWR